MHNARGTRALHPDRVEHRGERLVVRTVREMDDWNVRRYRRNVIVFEGLRYFVARKETHRGKEIDYYLEPWPERLNEMPGKTIYYDEDYVRERERMRRLGRRIAWERYLLFPFIPLIGLLPSVLKRRIEDRHGVSAHTATLASLWLELLGFLSLGVLVFSLGIANLYFLAVSVSFFNVFALACFVIGSILLLVDLAVRYGCVLKEEHFPLGLFEWVLPRRRTK